MVIEECSILGFSLITWKIISIFPGHNRAPDSKLFFISLLLSLTVCSGKRKAEREEQNTVSAG